MRRPMRRIFIYIYIRKNEIFLWICAEVMRRPFWNLKRARLRLQKDEGSKEEKKKVWRKVQTKEIQEKNKDVPGLKSPLAFQTILSIRIGYAPVMRQVQEKLANWSGKDARNILMLPGLLVSRASVQTKEIQRRNKDAPGLKSPLAFQTILSMRIGYAPVMRQV